MLASSLLLGLALLVPDASATKIRNVRIKQIQNGHYDMKIVVIVKGDDNDEVANVAAELDGVEGPLTETDAWQHGTATLDALPEGADLTLTAYAADGSVSGSWAGSYADGALLLDPVASGGCAGPRCAEGSGESTAADVELLGLHYFEELASGEAYGRVALGLDFAGADLYDVVYATLRVTEWVETGEPVCVLASRTDGCLEWGYETTPVTTETEVDWAELGSVWESEDAGSPGYMEIGGASVQFVVKAYDADGNRLAKARGELAAPWDDGGEGVGALFLDEDPLTTGALARACTEWNAYDGTCQEMSDGFVVVSDGWTLGDTLPELAEVEWENGETWGEVTPNSYQLAASVPVAFEGDSEAEAFRVVVDGVPMVDATGFGDRGMCEGGVCVALDQDEDGAWLLGVTAYAADPDDLPTSVNVELVPAYGAAYPTADGWDVSFDDDVAVVFAVETSFAGDPAGLDLIGKVKLLGPANKRGNRDTLAKGKIKGQLGTDGDGDLGFAAIDPDEETVSRGDILIGGEPIGIESEVPGEDVRLAPPVIQRSNGKGTRNVATSTSTSVGLL